MQNPSSRANLSNWGPRLARGSREGTDSLLDELSTAFGFLWVPKISPQLPRPADSGSAFIGVRILGAAKFLCSVHCCEIFIAMLGFVQFLPTRRSR
jgi:hypothetical protein